MNIVLVGLRGCGKSAVGKAISKKLGIKLIEIDEEVEKNQKMSIKEIVEKKGWDHFRKIEKEITQEIEEKDDCVISTGGGTIMDPENKKALRKNGKIVYLYRKPRDFIQYLSKDRDRPALTNKETLEEEIEEIYSQRNQTYCKSAQLIFHRTDSVSSDAKEIIKSISPTNEN
jgi:shikimate kinase